MAANTQEEPTYSRDFHREGADQAEGAARRLAPRIVELFHPHSAIDVGCGSGAWLDALRTLGIEDIRGIDFGVHPGELRIPPDRYVDLDLRAPFAQDRTFDLAICLEVAEHLPAGSADSLVESLASLAPAVVFSAAIPHQGGVNHLNEQWPDYWSERFRKWGFASFDCFRRDAWDSPEVPWWYAQNMVAFVKESATSSYPMIQPYAVDRPARLVHPANYLAHSDPGQVGAGFLLRALPRAILRRVRSRK